MVIPTLKSNLEIIIPIGNISNGDTKTRLSPNLNNIQRKNLTVWLLNHVVNIAYKALSQLNMNPNITILSNTYPKSQFDYISHIYSMKNQIHIKCLGNSLNDSLQQYIGLLHNVNKLILPADLGMITIDNIVKFIKKSGDFKTPVIAKATKDNGTNGLLLPLEKDFTFKFGENSFESHKKILNRYKIMNSLGLNNDIDDYSDLMELIRSNNNIQKIIDIEKKVVIPTNKFEHIGNGINTNCKCHILDLPNDIKLRESKNLIYNNKSIDISIN